MSTYKALNKIIDLGVVHEMVASGITRIRANTDELTNLFESLTTERQTEIITWFTGDKCNIQHKWNYVPIHEEQPSITYALSYGKQTESFIGDSEGEDFQTSNFDTQSFNHVFPFERQVICLTRYHNDPTYTYYLHEIVKYIILSYKDTFVGTYNFKNLRFSEATEIVEKTDSWIFQYKFILDYEMHKTIRQDDLAQEIVSTGITQTKYLQTIQETDTDYSKL